MTTACAPALPLPLPLPLAANEWRVDVSFADVDQMQVVHHARYWQWFEDARFHFLERVLGLSVADIVATGVFTPLVAAECTYLRPVRWGDVATIRVDVAPETRSRLVFLHELRTAGESPCARARTVHVFTDTALRLRCTIPPLYAERLLRARAEFPACFAARDWPAPDGGRDARHP
ncbi:MAG: acyl-CoA thioesterase [Gemmatimonadaceae bacterium]